MKRFLNEIWTYFKDFLIWLINYFFLIWAHFPILSLTSDINFTNLQLPIKNCSEIRFSILTFYFGEYVFHFCSFNLSKKQFSLIKVLSLSTHPKFDDNCIKGEIEEKINTFNNEVSSIEDDNIIEVETECLKRKVDDNNSRIDKAETKINFFLTIILAIITLVSFNSLRDLDTTISVSNFLKVFLLYFSINLCALLIQSMKVRSFYSLSFNDLRESDKKQVYYLRQLYEELLYSDKKANFFVSFVHRIFDYMKIIIIIGISLFMLSINKSKEKNIVFQDNKLIILNEKECFINYSDDNLKLYEVLLDLKNQNYSRVIIMTKSEPKKELIDTFYIYDKQKISYILDESLSEDDIKIILEN